MKISVCISTWNRVEKLAKVIECVENQDFDKNEFEIIVSDSHSTDSTDEIVEKLAKKYGNILHIHTDNIVSCKRNMAVREARGEIIILLDDDVYPQEGFLKAHYEANTYNCDSFFCGQVRFDANRMRNSNYYRFRNSQHLGSERRSKALDFNYIVTMNVSFPKYLYQKVGDMLESYRGYGCEDLDYGYRIIERGFQLKYLPEALAIHDEGSSDILQYGKKLYKTGLYGSRIFKRECPEAWKILYYRKEKLSGILSISIFRVTLGYYLKLTDSNKVFYSYFLFKLYLYMCYSSGVIDRKYNNELSIKDCERGW